jgi:hypothetical protein
MPHVSDIRAMSPDHDRHDLMLVAALAAGDLAGIDRDHALDLTSTCASCAELHDDLVAIAHATASVPPPVTVRPRDFQLTPADAARLQPAGWRRFRDALAGIPAAFSRPLGVGLATLGLVGLIVGNAPAINVGGSAASPATAPSLERSSSGGGDAAGAVPAASGAPAMPEASSAASAGAASALPVDTRPLASSPPRAAESAGSVQLGPAANASASAGAVFGSSQSGGQSSSASDRLQALTDGSTKSSTDLTSGGAVEPSQAAPEPLRPLNILFALAVILGLAVLVLDRARRRARA